MWTLRRGQHAAAMATLPVAASAANLSAWIIPLRNPPPARHWQQLRPSGFRTCKCRAHRRPHSGIL